MKKIPIQTNEKYKPKTKKIQNSLVKSTVKFKLQLYDNVTNQLYLINIRNNNMIEISIETLLSCCFSVAKGKT